MNPVSQLVRNLAVRRSSRGGAPDGRSIVGLAYFLVPILATLACAGISACSAPAEEAMPVASWAQTYGPEYYRVASVQPTADGGYVAAGETDRNATAEINAWVRKLDAAGNVIWERTFDGGGADNLSAVQPTADGGYVAAGATQSAGSGATDAWVLKLDASGNVIWQKTYGGAGYDYARDVRPTADGGYVVVGGTGSFSTNGSDNGWVLKLDPVGNIVWQKIFGGLSSSANPSTVRLVPGGGYVLAGWSVLLTDYREKVWVVKLDVAGDIVWQKTYGGTREGGSASDVRPTTDGGFIVVGSIISQPALWSEAWIAKLDAGGEVMWQKTYVAPLGVLARSVALAPDGGYVVAMATMGVSSPEASVLKVDARGSILRQQTFGDQLKEPGPIEATADGGFVWGAQGVSISSTHSNAWVLKLDKDGALTSCANPVGPTIAAAGIDDSPANGTATVADTDVTPLAAIITATATKVVAQAQCRAPPLHSGG